MKKTIAMLTMVLFTFLQTVKAASGATVPSKVQTAFEQRFNKSTNVEWNKMNDVFVASFKCNNEKQVSYFTEEGECLGTGRYVPKTYLPFSTANALAEKFNAFIISQVFEFNSAAEGTSYYIIMASEKTDLIVIANNSGLNVAKKLKK